jgi:NADH-quinone oxidoreductase subunit A
MVFTWLNLGILLFLAGGLSFAAGPLLAAVVLAPKARGEHIGRTYECGLPTHGATWVNFGVNYYFYALIFLAFDVDVLYLFPVATRFIHTTGWLPVLELLIFVAVLFAAILYFFRKGVFTWPRKIKV